MPHTFGDFNARWRSSVASSTDPLIDLTIKLERTNDLRARDCPNRCIGVLGPGSGPHAYALHCSTCGRHCGWLPRRAAAVLRDLIEIGRLSSAPILRDRSIRP
jgi:hypothetical protein